MDKRQTAMLLGYGDDIAAMDADHDLIHVVLCEWLGITSYSLKVGAGERLPFEQHTLANYEEDAVLCIQRLIRAHRVTIPEMGLVG